MRKYEDTYRHKGLRRKLVDLLKEKGITVEERPLSIDEIVAAHKDGKLKEAFGTGTAASIAPIAELTYHENHMMLPPMEQWDVANWLKRELSDIRYGRVADTRDWILPV